MPSNNTPKNNRLKSDCPNNQGFAQDFEDDLLPEYDFGGGVRGKHFAAYQKMLQQRQHQLGNQSPDGI
jgi:hypothetical protein